MLNAKSNPKNIAVALAVKDFHCDMLSASRYAFWLAEMQNQIVMKVGDKGDDGFVVEYDGTYFAFWFTGTDGEYVHMHTALEFLTPFQALDCLVEIVKIDHESLEEEAREQHGL